MAVPPIEALLFLLPRTLFCQMALFGPSTSLVALLSVYSLERYPLNTLSEIVHILSFWPLLCLFVVHSTCNT